MLSLLAAFFVCSGIVIALYIATDLKRNPQSMKIMNAVWILTGLWGSYVALWAYRKFGRDDGEDHCSMDMQSGRKEAEDMPMKMNMDMHQMAMDKPMSMDMNMRPHWQSIALSALHCGAGCTLADIIVEGLTFFFPVSIGGSMIVGSWVFDFILALAIGVFFQYYAIREMEKIPALEGIKRAFKADFFSLLSWQVGMYGWMAIVYFVIFANTALPKDSWMFWFMMQIAMLFGFFCAFPVNALLIKLGVKKGM
uniref:DUF4396 domain-containing protein n=1 Tax=uncultured Dysgonomonas sp. TaxID=206096 RepID=UPI0026331488|nr:DUF4396 domain-containing protein [uncultured Dysgonomonas sp.]